LCLSGSDPLARRGPFAVYEAGYETGTGRPTDIIVMGRHKGDDKQQSPRADTRRALVYLPCPACRRAVQLADETRVEDDPETYECPSCGARFLLVEP
jgi:predicted RNA-binding Zn-ribbon protein involved in translation (DUF1610 family)